MGDLINFALERSKKFTVLDWTMIKLTLFSAGALFGIHFAKCLKPWKKVIFVIFIFSYVFTMYRFLKE